MNPTPPQAAGYQGGYFTKIFGSADTFDSPYIPDASIGILRRRNKKTTTNKNG